MQWSRGALGVLVWVARLGCTQGRVVPWTPCHAILLSMSTITDGHLCPLEPPHVRCLSHPVLPTFPKIVGCEASLICCGLVKLLWEGLS